ncbi:hypothetical protein Dimus_008380, partial [Dionaea muscipula]
SLTPYASSARVVLCHDESRRREKQQRPTSVSDSPARRSGDAACIGNKGRWPKSLEIRGEPSGVDGSNPIIAQIKQILPGLKEIGVGKPNFLYILNFQVAFEKQAWKVAMERAKGKKVHDDPKKLKESTKREKKLHKKSVEKLKERVQNVETKKQERQGKRKENIKAKIDQKKMREIEKRGKKLM